MQKTALIILDGFGINADSPEKNAIARAKTPTFDRLFGSLHTKLGASGLAVGVPEGQMGNSEIGHLTIGSGRILAQSIVRIDELFRTGRFQELPTYRDIMEHARQKGRIHVMGLLGPGGVHAHTGHLLGFLDTVPEDISVNLHLFSDGRDTEPTSFLGYLEDLLHQIAGKTHIKIASIAGRYSAMDRDTNWDRTEEAYRTIVGTVAPTDKDPVSVVKQNYEAGTTDEFIKPVSFADRDPIEDGEAIVFLNFRSDRAKQLTRAFADKDFNGFERKDFHDIHLATMTRYYPEFTGTVFIEDEKPQNLLGEILAANNIRQLHIAETEKFAHVTKFFNGGRGEPYEGETDILIPSHKVATYDLDPAMSAYEILEAFRKDESEYPFVVINFANGDMVGHTGKMDAAIRAVETLDEVIADLIGYCHDSHRDLLITADHGNVEDVGTPESPMTAHTCNLVPFWHIRAGEVLLTRAD